MKDFMEQLKKRNDIQNGMIILAIILGIVLAFRYLLPIVIPFLIALIIAGVLRPIVDWLIRKVHWSEKRTAVIVLISIGGLIVLIGGIVVSILIRQAENLVSYLPFYKAQFMVGLDNCCYYIDNGLRLKQGASIAYATEVLAGIFSDFQTTVLPKITSQTVAVVKYAFASILFLFIMLYATLCMLKNYPYLFGESEMGNGVRKVIEKMITVLSKYLRAEGLIMLAQMLICAIGLWILDSPYFILLAVLIGVLDAFPVCGCGTILVPWAIFRLLMGDIFMMAGLLVLWGLCALNRQFLEPRLLGRQLGMGTLLSLFLMYVGYRLFGIFGFILGPLGYLIGREIFELAKKQRETLHNLP